MSKLMIVRGQPGSGKSTFANWLGCFHVENDFFWVRDSKYEFIDGRKELAITWCMHTAKHALELSMDVVVANTFVKKSYIEAYKRIADECNAQFEVYCMKGTFENKHAVPLDVKKSMIDEWEDWDDEMFIYPNMHFDKDDPVCRPYMATRFKIGDHVIAQRFKGGKDTISFDEEVEMEEAEAIVTNISQATYDYLNIFFKFIDNGKAGLAMSGDLKKCEVKHD